MHIHIYIYTYIRVCIALKTPIIDCYCVGAASLHFLTESKIESRYLALPSNLHKPKFLVDGNLAPHCKVASIRKRAVLLGH